LELQSDTFHAIPVSAQRFNWKVVREGVGPRKRKFHRHNHFPICDGGFSALSHKPRLENPIPDTGLRPIDNPPLLCNFLHMATNLAIDNALLSKALKIGGRKTKKATVTEALEEYIRRREQRKILRFFGTIEQDNYDPKGFRRHS